LGSFDGEVFHEGGGFWDFFYVRGKLIAVQAAMQFARASAWEGSWQIANLEIMVNTTGTWHGIGLFT